MIIFNLKGLLVGVVVVVPFFILGLLGLNIGIAMVLSSALGLFVSIKLTRPGASFFRMPSIFFIPTHAYSVVLMLLGVAVFFVNPGLGNNQDVAHDDPRPDQVQRDLEYVKDQQVLGIRTVSGEVLEVLKDIVPVEMEPENISVLVRQNSGQDKALLLVRFPKIDDMETNDRSRLILQLENRLADISFFDGKALYIGIEDASSLLWITSNPEEVKNSRLDAGVSDLLDYYGDWSD